MSQVALYAGFDLSRDASTHHLQEKLFDAHLQMARKIRLPLVVRICDATDKLIEVLENQGSSESAPATSSSSVFASGEQPSAAVKLCVFGCTPASCCLAQLQKLLAFDCSIAVDAAFTHESAGWSEFLRAIPDNRLMLASDAPHHTPQNIEDEWIRKQVLVSLLIFDLSAIETDFRLFAAQ
jgi:Tat protein secretion system quality control protein TatD with DNase activity